MSAAYEYGRALFMLGEEEGISDGIKSDAQTVRAVLKENPEYIKLLDTPALTKEERLAAIDGSLGTLDENLVNLIKILSGKHMAHLVPRVLDVFDALYDERCGIERVEAISAVAMSDGQIDRLARRLAEKTGKTIIVRNTVDPSILGGIKVRYMGIQLDGSVKTRLDGFERALHDVII
ncbi:MAG: ATP synthase F1 subunit delta [Clostridia bacterium]|nr:ATP synthase F1 subunit delta [Clostridia bacterium]